MKKILKTFGLMIIMIFIIGGAAFAANSSSYNSTLRISMGITGFKGAYREYKGSKNMNMTLSMTTKYERSKDKKNADCKLKVTLYKKTSWFTEKSIASKYYREGKDSKTWKHSNYSSITSGDDYAYRFDKTANANYIKITSNNVKMTSK